MVLILKERIGQSFLFLGLFSGPDPNALTFGAVAAKEKTDKSIFTIKDSKAVSQIYLPKKPFCFAQKDFFCVANELLTLKWFQFEPQTVFGSASAKANTSKDEVEEYEPQVDFKPVVPMPDLVDIKTGSFTLIFLNPASSYKRRSGRLRDAL